jgi:hypothetical protein
MKHYKKLIAVALLALTGFILGIVSASLYVAIVSAVVGLCVAFLLTAGKLEVEHLQERHGRAGQRKPGV